MPIRFDAADEVPADAAVLAVPVLAGCTLPPGTPAAEVDLEYLVARGFDGKCEQVEPLMAEDGSTVLAVGLGDIGEVDLEALRRGAAAAVKKAWKSPSLALALLDAAPGLDPEAAARAMTEGAALAAYKFGVYKSDPDPCRLEWVTVVGPDVEALQAGVERGESVAAAVSLARDLVNEPPGRVTPRRLEEVAREIAAEHGLDVEVYDEDDVVAEGLGGLGGVAAGSDEPPRLIQMTYTPPGEAAATVALVGKGITFDSGGLSIKTSEGMMTMKCDMSGAAAVIAAMAAVAEAQVPVRVIGFAACTENLPSGKAIKPGDVLKIRNGKTVEVLNTDAEGRLVLADALSLAVEEEPDAIIDLATLTGACIVSLGPDIAGLMTNDDALATQVEAAAARAGEPVWRLPLPARYRKHIDSEVADIKNIGLAGKAGTLSAGLFLKEFVGDVPWVHLDIAGPAFRDDADSYLPKGGTGFGVRTLVELLADFEPPAG